MHVFFWKDALTPLLKLHKPFEVTLLPEEFCCLFSYWPSLRSHCYGWWDSRTSQLGTGCVTISSDGSAGCMVFKSAVVMTGSDLEHWVALQVTDRSRFDHRKQRQPYFYIFYGMTTTLGHINGPTDLACHLSRRDKSRCPIQNTHDEFTAFPWHRLPAIYGSQRPSEATAGTLRTPFQNGFYFSEFV